MNSYRLYIGLLFLVLCSQLSWSQIPSGYYDSANGLSGETLRTELKTIISNGHIKLPYTSTSFDTWDAYQYTDVRPASPNIIWDMYSDRPSSSPAYTYTLFTSQCGTSAAEGDCYSREHCFPKSWWGGADNATNPQYTDLHHLFPADQYVNNKKNNYPIGKVNPTAVSWTSTNGSKVGNCGITGYTGFVFEPIDEYKGDFARAYLYIITRYKDQVSSWVTANSTTQISDLITGNQYKTWFLNMLIDWSTNDPVSAKEISRNNAIYYQTPQHNRNPFVDHPEYVSAIWGTPLSVSAPVATAATSVSSSAFTANWNTVANATDGYLLDVSTHPNFSIANPQFTNDLLFSEYVEGSGSNKYIEIYNGTGASVNLSDYRLQLFLNGATNASFSNQLSGTLPHGSTVVYKNINTNLYTGQTTGLSNFDFNGDDAIALYKISTASYVDIFGRIGEDPGTAWTSSTFTTLDKTLTRLPSITSGITVNPTTGFPSLSTQWLVSDVDDVSDLGTHSFNNNNLVDSFVTGYQGKVISGQATNNTIVSGLAPSTIYYYRLRAKNGSTISANSNIIATSCSSLITPTFDQVAVSCSGSTIAALPTTSLNGFSGAWSPPINNTVTTTYTFTPNVGQCASSTTMTITIGCGALVNLKVDIQGYYNVNTNLMDPVLLNQNVSSNNTDVAQIEVSLFSPINFSKVDTCIATLKTDGTAVCTFNTAPSGSYYIVIEGNNFIRTWSASPQLIGNTPLNYDFTASSSMAFGNNMAEVQSGIWALYSGDINQDSVIDSTDYVLWETRYNDFAFGQEDADISGDGIVDSSDYVIWETNYMDFIMEIIPDGF